MSRSRVATLRWRPGAVVPALLLVAGLAACTEDEPGDEPADGAAASDSSAEASGPSEESASPGQGDTEPITSQGVAAVVRDVLGAEAVQRFGSYPADGGQVSVMVVLSEGDPRDMFAVSVSSAADVAPDGGCEAAAGTSACEELADGRVVISDMVEGGFSEDNPEGVVVFASVQGPDGSGAQAMYESYDDTPPVAAEQLADLVSDPRLAWETAPSTNAAGADVEIEELTG